MIKNNPLPTMALCFCSIGVISCDGENPLASSWGKPSCDSEREVGDWTITTSLSRSQYDELAISKWEARKEFTSNFELGVIRHSTPYLQIRHNYTSGEFKMVLPENGLISAKLSSSYALTEVALRPVDIDYLRSAAVTFEHIDRNQHYQKYTTEGLPEAIEAAEADLASAKQKMNEKACAPSDT